LGELVGMVLCAGLGTRMRPLTSHLPKPALPLCGLPLVRYALALLAGAGVRRAVVNVHHLAARMEEEARRSAGALGLEIAISCEVLLAGTGGALREARPLLAGASEILLLNGDVLFDADLSGALAAHRASGALATMVLAPMPPGAPYAAVEADVGLAVRRIGSRFGPAAPGLLPWHFTGAHVLAPELLDQVPAVPYDCDVNRQVYPPLLDGRVRGHVDGGYWNDLGHPGGYLQAHRELLAGKVPLGRFRGADPFAGLSRAGEGIWLGAGVRVEPGALLQPPALLLEGARVERGATVGPFAVLGRGCRVGAGAAVADAVLWDGSAIEPGERISSQIAAGALRVDAR
jgi:mannose-1-phosphate guanylyltransferase